MPGRPRVRGAGSRYLHGLRPGDRLNVFLDSADGFRLQQDTTKPMIFVSAGTGLAPMRAFLWERLAMRRAGAALAEAALFNGIRSPGTTTSTARRSGSSRPKPCSTTCTWRCRASTDRREYVQDQIRAQGALVWRLLEAGGYVYVCGSAPVRAAVRAALTDVIADHGALPRERAAAYLDELETSARYRPDLWG